MAAGDHVGLIEACMRLGDAARGGDPQLWTDVLDYLTKQPTDCTQQVHCTIPLPGTARHCSYCRTCANDLGS